MSPRPARERPKRRRTGQLLRSIEGELVAGGLEVQRTLVERFHALAVLEAEILNKRVLPPQADRTPLHELANQAGVHVSQVSQVERRVVRRVLAILRAHKGGKATP